MQDEQIIKCDELRKKYQMNSTHQKNEQKKADFLRSQPLYIVKLNSSN